MTVGGAIALAWLVGLVALGVWGVVETWIDWREARYLRDRKGAHSWDSQQ